MVKVGDYLIDINSILAVHLTDHPDIYLSSGLMLSSLDIKPTELEKFVKERLINPS